MVALALFDGDGDIDGLAVAAPGDQGNAKAITLGVDIFKKGFADGHLEIAVVAIEAANANFQILAQFFTVVGLREHRDIPEVQRNRIRPVVAHGADQLAVAEGVVSCELNFPDLDLRAFLDLKNQNDGVAGSDALVLWGDFRELAAVLAQQFLQHDFGFLDFRGIELAFDAQTDLAFLESVQNVRFGNGVNTIVADATDLGAFLHLKDNDFAAGAIGRIFHAELYVLEELRVPQRLKIAPQGLFIVDITIAAEDARLQRVATHAAVADKFDAIDDKLLLLRGGLRICCGTVLYNLFARWVIKGSRENVGM